MSFNTDNYLKSLKTFELKSLFIEELHPYWEQVAFEVSSCRSSVTLDDQPENPFCILGLLELNTYIQMKFCEADEWYLELRITQENGKFTHYYGIVEGSGDSDTISDMGVILEAFKDFYNGNYQPRNVVWIILDI